MPLPDNLAANLPANQYSGSSPTFGERFRANIYPEAALAQQRLSLEQIRVQLDIAAAQRAQEAQKATEQDRIFKRLDRKSTRLNSSHIQKSRMPSSA